MKKLKLDSMFFFIIFIIYNVFLIQATESFIAETAVFLFMLCILIMATFIIWREH